MEALRSSLILSHSVSYLRFENGAINTDSIGGMTFSTGGGTPANTTGKFGKGVTFGATDYITSINALSRAPFVNGWWMNVWVRNWNGAVFSSKAGSYENYVGLNGANIFSHVQTTTDIGKDGGVGLPAGFDATKYNMMTWIAMSSAGLMHLKYYVNAVQLADQTFAGVDPGLCEAQSRIGYFYTEGKNGTVGDLDDLLMGANTIITDTEIKQLYQSRGFPIAALL